VRYDRASVTDEPLFARCLAAGFDEVLALGGETNGRARPASFTLGGPDVGPSTLNGGPVERSSGATGGPK
jgi:hypothetical protein